MLRFVKYEPKYERAAEKFGNDIFGSGYILLKYVDVDCEKSIVIFFENRIVGMIIVAPDTIMQDVDFVCYLCIHENWRRIGLAMRLLNMAAKLSTRDMALFVNVNNNSAINLYEKKAFIKAFVVPRYYGAESAFLMFRKKL